MATEWDPGDFPDHMVYQGDCGPSWVQIGPANWRIRWKGDMDLIAEIAFRRFGRRLTHAVRATAVRSPNPDYVEVTMLFCNPPSFLT